MVARKTSRKPALRWAGELSDFAPERAQIRPDPIRFFTELAIRLFYWSKIFE